MIFVLGSQVWKDGQSECVCQNSNQMVMEYIQEGEEERNRQQIASFRIVTSCTGYFKKVSSYYSVYMIDMQQQF